MNEYEIYNRLTSGLSIPFEGINVNKDGNTVTVPAKGLIEMLFDISDLTDCEKSVMRYMSIMPVTGIDVGLFEN